MVDTLLIDDNPDLLRLVEMLLTLDGRFSVTGQADNLVDAEHLLRRNRPELVVTDLVLGSKRLDSIATFADVPWSPCVAVLSGFDRLDAEAGVLAAGAHGYFEKAEINDLPDGLFRLVESRRSPSD